LVNKKIEPNYTKLFQMVNFQTKSMDSVR